ncbi:hypothetical protein [Burkholderia sp. MSMB1072]|uniref:hypothetical protein n=1 Tax=Burkholderia sp. MSMB1072 TaxID=1637871 RepID=UPI000A5AE60D|nr:hypothetical protein [Burkholderia sp. MSMB1072]
MAAFTCDCGEEMDEGAVSCSAIIPPATDEPGEVPAGHSLVITATCPKCGVQRAGVFSANELTAI